jgi:hypothetical protein
MVTEITLFETSPLPLSNEASRSLNEYRLGAGIRRLLPLPQRHPGPQPEPARPGRRGAEKTTHLARRRGGGMTARAGRSFTPTRLQARSGWDYGKRKTASGREGRNPVDLVRPKNGRTDCVQERQQQLLSRGVVSGCCIPLMNGHCCSTIASSAKPIRALSAVQRRRWYCVQL